MTKKCSKCRIEKDVSAFSPDKRTSTGLYSACRACHSACKYRTSKEWGKKWKANNREKYLERSRIYKKRHFLKYKDIPRYKLNRGLSAEVSHVLRGRRPMSNWSELFGYTVETFRRHMESQFEPWMSWDNYGVWTIDHIRPISSFPFESSADPSFRVCWALENLRPLEKSANLKKSYLIIKKV